MQRLRSLASQPCPGDEDRQDLTGLASLSIDDAGTIEVDDALALEPRAAGGWRLWIHVADPTALLSLANPLALEACRRGCSTYLSHGATPMFPESLALGVFSLRPGQRCRALSFWVDVDDAGHALAEGWSPSWVQLSTAITYNDVDDLLSMAPPEEDSLLELHRITRQLNQERRAAGALCLEQPEARFRPTASGHALPLMCWSPHQPARWWRSAWCWLGKLPAATVNAMVCLCPTGVRWPALCRLHRSWRPSPLEQCATVL